MKPQNWHEVLAGILIAVIVVGFIVVVLGWGG